MKRYLLSAFMAIVCCVGCMAQDALVIEWHNGLADIFTVTPNLHIDNGTENDSVFVMEADSLLASYARADIKRIAFDDEVVLTDSVERAALVALYKATDGDNWKDNTNWCTDKPLSEWYGVSCNDRGVCYLLLSYNNLNGIIPKEIGNLIYLQDFILYGNGNISGTIPSSIGRMTDLRYFELGWPSQVTGEIPKEIGNLSKLVSLFLFNNKLTGPIPPELGNLTNLVRLDLGANSLSGSIPRELGNLNKLKRLILDRNQLTGEIPKELGNLTKLEQLNLFQNQLTGEIPESFNNLKELVRSRGDSISYIYMETWSNNLSGKVPSLFTEHPAWAHEWWNLLAYNSEYNLEEDVYVPALEFKVTDLDGNVIDSKETFSKNKYTAIFCWATWCGFSNALMADLIPLYKKYKDHGFDVIGVTQDGGANETEEDVRKYIADRGVKWHNIYATADNNLNYHGSNVGSTNYFYPGGNNPDFTIVDSNGRVVFYDQINERSSIGDFLKERLGEGSNVEVYESTDFSDDGIVETLQEASTEKDIKVVIMGDGFSDRLIADGTYDATMQRAMVALFTTEPVKSYQDCFTVKSVTAVSTNEIFSDTTQTALGGFNNVSGLGVSTEKVLQYAQKAISAEDMDDAIIIVVLNSELAVGSNEGGVCYMFHPEVHNTWGRGASVSVVPNMTGNGGAFDVTSFETVLSHEAIGHGFAKLGDEYVTKEMEIPSDEKANKQAETLNGWWKNADFTSNPEEVKWSTFITDDRYADEEIDVYEGGLTYREGVYRPTNTSIMGSNGTEFNAPSRMAIWYRINKLTQGEEWEGTYEDFVAFDLATRTDEVKSRAAQVKEQMPTNRPTYRGAPPVVMDHTWRSALETPSAK